MNNVANTQACVPEYNGVLNSAPNAHLRRRRHVRRAAMHPAGAAHGGRDAGLQVLEACGRYWRVFDLDQGHVEDQRLVRRDRVAGAVAAIAQVGRDHQFPAVACLHQLERFHPAGDQAAGGKLGRLFRAWSGRRLCR